ncbi:hypothetical protein RvY_03355 [Ramazzottius varieornatus]|uniref:Polycomb protein VEFS-Box domain-containing protein n=1 Tax=Ramazzottius varieornatus TaxID=947166 RepID=A0A1D1UR57_RAMVA|nr:hypothetical protein RvY_03355 [Ramazzottius varieornatus]
MGRPTSKFESLMKKKKKRRRKATIADGVEVASTSTSTSTSTVESGQVHSALSSTNGCSVSIAAQPEKETNSKRKRKTARKKAHAPSRAMPVSMRPELVRHFVNGHPLIAGGSEREAVDESAEGVGQVIPAVLGQKTLASLLTSCPLLATQCSVVCARWRFLQQARLFLRRSLTYNMAHRRLKPPQNYLQRSPETKRRNIFCLLQQLCQRQRETEEERLALDKGTYSYPVDISLSSFTLLRCNAPDSKFNNHTNMRHEYVELQLAVMRKAPEELLQRKVLEPALKDAKKVMGTVGAQLPAAVAPIGDGCQGPSQHSVCFAVDFPPSVKLRMEHWNLRNYLVVGSSVHSIDLLTGQKKVFNKMVAYNLCQLREPNGNLPLESAGVFENFKFQLTRGPCHTFKMPYRFVLIYNAGQHYQVRDMINLKSTFRPHGHVCVLCGMRCDSLVNVLRHLEGYHPSLGYEYDQQGQRIYLWFSPEHDFERSTVAGLLDHWQLLQFRRKGDGSAFTVPDDVTNPDGRPVFQWMSQRYWPDKPKDCLPKFSLERVLGVYGVPINPLRHYLHTSTVRSIRPEQRWLQAYDSDEETEWQDEYEREKLHDFIDCNPQEKYFMSLWNAFTRRLAPLMSFKMQDVLCRFVLQHAVEIELHEAYPALVAQLAILRRDTVITAPQSIQVIQAYRNTLACHVTVDRLPRISNGTSSGANSKVPPTSPSLPSSLSSQAPSSIPKIA